MKRVLFIFIMVSSCVSGEYESYETVSIKNEVRSVCEVMDDPSLYLGRYILIKGVYYQDDHQRLLYDNNCSEWELSIVHRIDNFNNINKDLLERIFRNNPRARIPVVYSGTIESIASIHGCNAKNCKKYSIRDANVLAVSQRK